MCFCSGAAFPKGCYCRVSSTGSRRGHFPTGSSLINNSHSNHDLYVQFQELYNLKEWMYVCFLLHRCLFSTRLCVVLRVCSRGVCLKDWPSVRDWVPVACFSLREAAWTCFFVSDSMLVRTMCFMHWRLTKTQTYRITRSNWHGYKWISTGSVHFLDSQWADFNWSFTFKSL